ncbi:GNAT family N-acetyltransferase [Deinococcus depolymerans]|uniref:GNAT family N-acetyltransferase n=1 Tax=Deinococcus depolymerans TaxID=392408 RepID=UPI0031DABF7C
MDPYLRGGVGCLLAERDGQLLGYVLGRADPGGYRRALLAAAGRVAGRIVRPDTRLSLRYLLRAARHPGPHADERQYPAHLHLNLLPGARGQGVGRQLLLAHLQALRDAGVPGTQLSTTTENVAALRLYTRAGFEVAAQRDSDLWTPWLGRPARHVVMVQSLRAPSPATPAG